MSLNVFKVLILAWWTWDVLCWGDFLSTGFADVLRQLTQCFACFLNRIKRCHVNCVSKRKNGGWNIAVVCVLIKQCNFYSVPLSRRCHRNRWIRLANVRIYSKRSIVIILFWRLKKSKSKALFDALSKNHQSIVASCYDWNWGSYSVAVVFFWKTFSWFKGYHGKSSWSILDSSMIHTLRFGILGKPWKNQ